MKFAELGFGDCGHCGTRDVQFNILWSVYNLTSVRGHTRSWATLGCPRCAGVTLLEMSVATNRVNPGDTLPAYAEVANVERRPVRPEDGNRIAHVPDGILEYFTNSRIVLAAGVPSAAAVELRRTLEAAAAHFEVKNGPLVKQIEELIDRGLVTKQFGEALTHVRKIGNVGAHHTDEKLSPDDIQLAARFAELLLRNLFEVPGELTNIQAESSVQSA